MTEADPTVFVVDDDPSVRRSTERLVRSMGFNVQTFATAKEFRERARVESPSCLVLDVHLPGPSGLDLQRELVQAGVQIPIIFITGRGSIPMSVRAMKGGAVEFLTKPTRSRDLLAAIRSAIERDRAAHQARRQLDAVRERYARLTAREREVISPRCRSSGSPRQTSSRRRFDFRSRRRRGRSPSDQPATATPTARPIA